MRNRWVCLWLVVLSVTAQAQWLNFQTPGVPRTKDGKPNLSAPAPRTADGKPDLSGVWMHETTTIDEMRRLFGAIIENDRPQVRGQRARGLSTQRAADDA
jgi:hypothetical protein